MTQASSVPQDRPPPGQVGPRLRRAIYGLVFVPSAMGLVGTAFSPWLLLNAPLLLLLLSPGAHNLILLAPVLDPMTLILVCTVRRFIAFLGTFGLGMLHGSQVLEWSVKRHPRMEGLIRWIESGFRRLGPVLLLPFPQHTLTLFAAASGSGARTTLGAILLGQLIQIWITVIFGSAVAQWTKPLMNFFRENIVLATLTTMALVSGYLFLKQKPKNSRR